MSKDYKQQERNPKYMVVKEIKTLEENVSVFHLAEEDTPFIYFKVLSERYLKNTLLRMDKADFVKRFSKEEKDSYSQGLTDVYRSRDWIFPVKVAWWNENIDDVASSINVSEPEYIILFMDLLEKYCDKFKVTSADFRIDFKFFDALLTDYRVDTHSRKLIPYKKRR